MFSTRECRRDVLGALSHGLFPKCYTQHCLAEACGNVWNSWLGPFVCPASHSSQTYTQLPLPACSMRASHLAPRWHPIQPLQVRDCGFNLRTPRSTAACATAACSLRATLRLWYHSTPSFSYPHQLHSRRSVAGAPRSGTHPTNRNRPAMEPPSACCHGVPRKTHAPPCTAGYMFATTAPPAQLSRDWTCMPPLTHTHRALRCPCCQRASTRRLPSRRPHRPASLLRLLAPPLCADRR